jgi:hypothetical protein
MNMFWNKSLRCLCSLIENHVQPKLKHNNSAGDLVSKAINFFSFRPASFNCCVVTSLLQNGIAQTTLPLLPACLYLSSFFLCFFLFSFPSFLSFFILLSFPFFDYFSWLSLFCSLFTFHSSFLIHIISFFIVSSFHLIVMFFCYFLSSFIPLVVTYFPSLI